MLFMRCGIADFTLKCAARRAGFIITVTCVFAPFSLTHMLTHAADVKPIAIAIHGGAGVIDRVQMTPEREASYLAGLSLALDAGYAALERGGSSLDAVTAAVRIMEDDPQFNAGRGAVLTHNGAAELDAAIMDGNGPRAGAVAGVMHVKNPIELARLVMEKSPHVFLIADGAEEFALEQGVILVPNSYFRTERRMRELEQTLREERDPLKPIPPPGTGTVGAVAFDRSGNVAAATSTGGVINRRHGRVGDSPLIGAGTYANNESGAVSGTGRGEFFIRSVVAHDICALVQYKRLSLDAAVHEVVQNKLPRLGGEGGVIAVDTTGHIAMDFNSVGMFRGARDSRGRREVAIYHDGR
jgi:L-asparaginase / beta-aspartyl-peptidase